MKGEADDQRGLERDISFYRGAMAAVVSKELWLLWRDPKTLALVLLRFAFLVPLAVMAASSLAWITVCGEEARELVEAAPIARWRLGAAKLAVACVLPLLALAPMAIWLGSLDLFAGLAMLPLAGVAALSMAVVQSWHGPRMPRTAFRKRPAALLLMGLIEI